MGLAATRSIASLAFRSPSDGSVPGPMASDRRPGPLGEAHGSLDPRARALALVAVQDPALGRVLVQEREHAGPDLALSGPLPRPVVGRAPPLAEGRLVLVDCVPGRVRLVGGGDGQYTASAVAVSIGSIVHSRPCSSAHSRTSPISRLSDRMSDRAASPACVVSLLVSSLVVISSAPSGLCTCRSAAGCSGARRSSFGVLRRSADRPGVRRRVAFR